MSSLGESDWDISRVLATATPSEVSAQTSRKHRRRSWSLYQSFTVDWRQDLVGQLNEMKSKLNDELANLSGDIDSTLAKYVFI